MATEDSARYVDVNDIADSIEKVHKILIFNRKRGNTESIITWERILAALQMRWRDAMVEVRTNGKYNF
jgi:hypothetical protein